jgi:hypothetical protein
MPRYSANLPVNASAIFYCEADTPEVAADMFRNGDCEMGEFEIGGIADSGYVEDLTADDVSEEQPAEG